MNKKFVKILFGVIIITIAAIGMYLLNAPKEIPLTKVTLKTAELTFMEQGYVAGGQVMEIYPLCTGKVLSVEVKKVRRLKKEISSVP